MMPAYKNASYKALEIRETANYNLDGIDYDIRICDTPEEMEAIVLDQIATSLQL